MKKLFCAILGSALLACGCNTTGNPNKTAREPATIGHPVQSVLKSHAKQRMEFFDKSGKQVRELPRNDSGSVSIFAADDSGQDNYAFDKNGVIVKHKRSYGEDYDQGKWRDAK